MESAICLGNTIIPFFSYESLAALYLLIPIVLVEALILKAVLKLEFKKVLLACLIANLLSTLCGASMWFFEMFGYLVAMAWSEIAGGIWLLSLFGVAFFISFYVERWYYLRQWRAELPVKPISKACLFANLATYIPLLALMFFMSRKYEKKAYKKAYRISCGSNLKQIGLAINQYAIDNKGFFPSGKDGEAFETLRSQGYLTDYKIFLCPNVEAKIPKDGSPLKSEDVSYLYFGSGLTENDSPDSPIACEKPDNHELYGNVLFLDGHVQGFPGANWLEQAKNNSSSGKKPRRGSSSPPPSSPQKGELLPSGDALKDAQRQG